MKISTRGRYALRLMVELALNYHTNTNLSLKTISQKQDISIKYLEQIVTPIARAGYVTSIRGAQGGYRLAGKPADYTVGMILRITEGSLCPVACVEEDHESCDRLDCCITYNVWAQIRDAVSNVVDHITLEDLVQDYYLKNPKE